ncbi:hypothetical protein [Methanobrevibacter sp.]|uniref:hypothetical protein n=1 Tax=Methanobrevibacter sp. TaxID=66852 RepID=UPI0025F5D9EE|nr:hypothetical protein [Methanobrevibacter sp.]
MKIRNKFQTNEIKNINIESKEIKLIFVAYLGSLTSFTTSPHLTSPISRGEFGLCNFWFLLTSSILTLA